MSIENKKEIWLVEIRFKDWIATLPGESRTFTYEEVIATGEFGARYAGIDQFERRCKYEPVMRRKFEQRGLRPSDYCAPDAVALESAE